MQKSMFGGLEAGPEGGKIDKKRHREKEEEGRESKLGTRGLKIAQQSRKRALHSVITRSDGTSGRHISGPDGRGKGDRGEGKPSPGPEKQEKREVGSSCPVSNTPWACGQANFKRFILFVFQPPLTLKKHP